MLKKISVFKIILLTAAACAVLYAVYYNFIFLPNDIAISRKEFLAAPRHADREIIQYAFLSEIDRAVFSGDMTVTRMAKEFDRAISEGFNIKKESLTRAVRSNHLFRFGTGAPGIWVDDRSCMLIPDGASVSFNAVLDKSTLLECAALSACGDGLLTISAEPLSGNRSSVTVELAAYKNPYGSKDYKLPHFNIGYPRAVAPNGWNKTILDVSKLPKGFAKITFAYKGKGAALVSNPRMFCQPAKKTV